MAWNRESIGIYLATVEARQSYGFLKRPVFDIFVIFQLFLKIESVNLIYNTGPRMQNRVLAKPVGTSFQLSCVIFCGGGAPKKIQFQSCKSFFS